MLMCFILYGLRGEIFGEEGNGFKLSLGFSEGVERPSSPAPFRRAREMLLTSLSASEVIIFLLNLYFHDFVGHLATLGERVHDDITLALHEPTCVAVTVENGRYHACCFLYSSFILLHTSSASAFACSSV